MLECQALNRAAASVGAKREIGLQGGDAACVR